MPILEQYSCRERISVLMPVFNGAQFIAQAIESVLCQTYENLELIIADDCSSDGSYEIALTYARHDSRVQVYRHKERQGQYVNYNFCIDKSTGSLIKPFAGDDIIEPACLEKMTDALTRHPSASLVVCGKHVIDAEGEIIETVNRRAQEELVSGAGIALECLSTFTNKIGEPCTVLFRKEHANGGFRTGYFSFGDVDFWLRLLEQGNLVVLDEVLCRYRFRLTSQRTESIADLRFLGDIFLLADSHRHTFLQAGLSDSKIYRLAAKSALFWLRYYSDVFGIDTKSLLESLRERQRQCYPKETQGADFRLAALEMVFYALELEDKLRLKDSQSTELTKLELERELSKMGNSLSWRITKPLRDAKRSTQRRIGNSEKS